MTLIFALYTFIILYTIIIKKWMIAVGVVASIPLFVILIKALKKIKIFIIKNKINVALEKHRNNVLFKPFLNINSSPWYIIELLPGVSVAQAKNLAMQIKEIRKVKTFDELFKIIALDAVSREIVKKIVKL